MRRDDSDDVAYAIVEAVADREGEDPLELPPLWGRVDGDALNALFDAGASGGVERVTFVYHGYEVTVRPGGRVNLEPAKPTT